MTMAIYSESVAGQSAATRLTGATFVDATAKLGDRGDRIAATDDGAGSLRSKFG